MKISPYRTGELRFGTKDPSEPVHSEVTTWTMTPEQLEEYKSTPNREQTPMKKPISLNLKNTKEVKKVELTRELYTDLKAKGKTDKQIIDEYGLHSNLMQKLKNKWGLVKKSRTDYQKEVAQPHLADSQKKIDNQQQDIAELQRILGLKEKNIKELHRELEQKQAHIDKLATTITKQEEQILTLQIDAEEDIGFEEMKDELALYKERYEKTADLLKTFI